MVIFFLYLHSAACYAEDSTIYDGVVLMKNESLLITKAFGKVFGSYSKDKDRENGFFAMLPNCVAELMSGRPLDELCDWIRSLLAHQLEHLSGYSTFVYYIVSPAAKAAQICKAVSILLVNSIWKRSIFVIAKFYKLSLFTTYHRKRQCS